MTDSDSIDETTLAAAFRQISAGRRSVRGFLPTPVPQSLLDEIFSLSLTAPSNCNAQPWMVHVVSGAARDRMSEKLLQTIGEGERDLDFEENGPYPGVFRQRQVEVAVLLYESLGVSREDRRGRHDAFLDNLRFFNAPHVAFLFIPGWAGIREAVDVGMFAQNLMLAMEAYGLGSCAQTLLGYHASAVREQFEVEDSMKLLFGISFGYTDSSLPQNQIRTSRIALHDQVAFHR